MAYRELIKNFTKIREYLRDFYVYGFKNRDDFAINSKSARTYDDEKRRLESWLGDYMCFTKTSEGKTVFLSIDPRNVQHNPLYKTWKTKSFTDIDITLHFILLDILIEAKNSLSLKSILKQIDFYLKDFKNPNTVDESTIRKKLNEYISEGIIKNQKNGKSIIYSINSPYEFTDKNSLNDILNFYSEIAPCGVIGSFLLDKVELKNFELKNHFNFKHHYITSSMDSEILCEIFTAIRQRKTIEIEVQNRKTKINSKINVLPLQIFISVQSGRQYLLGFDFNHKQISSFRLDNMNSVKILNVANDYEKKRLDLEKLKKNMWGVSTKSDFNSEIEHIDFTITFEKYENFIYKRLLREKRTGTVTKIDENHIKFEIDVYNSEELIPWIRTFICRITEIHFSNENLENRFKSDIQKMYEMYGV